MPLRSLALALLTGVLCLTGCSPDHALLAAPAAAPERPALDITGTPTGPITSDVNESKCLDVLNESNSNGAKIVVWACHGGANQQWTATAASEFRVFGSKCLDLPAGAVDGTQLQIWTCHGGSNQKWTSAATVSAPGQIQSQSDPTKCADLWTGVASDGQKVTAYGCHGGINQRWNTPAVAPSGPAACTKFPAARVVNVSTNGQLDTAIATALPGDRIQMADGTYTLKRIEWKPMSAASPAVLCGTRAAIIQGTSPTNGIAALFIKESDHWIVSGITLRTSLRGVIVETSDSVRVTDVEIHNIGNSAVNVNKHSHRTVVDSNLIHHTGVATAQFGEGIYVGTYNGSWPGGVPDRSDSTVIRGNTLGPNIGSELIDVKEGTTGTQVLGNSLSGVGQNPATTNLNSLVVISGDDVTVQGNTLTAASEHGIITYVQLAPWGRDHVFHGNSIALDVGGSHYGFNIGGANIVVGCDNTVTGGSFSNVACTP